MGIRLLLRAALQPVFLWIMMTSMVTLFVLVESLPDRVWWSYVVCAAFVVSFQFVLGTLGRMQAICEDHEVLKQEGP